MRAGKTLLIIFAVIFAIFLICNIDGIISNEVESKKQNTEQLKESIPTEKVDFVKKGEEQITIFNTVCDDITIDESMIIQTTDVYTEIQLPSIKWIISELDGNPSYRFIYSRDADLEDVNKEMAYAFYASLYPDETLRYWVDTGVAARINREDGRYNYGNWILEIEETSTERIIEYYMNPW